MTGITAARLALVALMMLQAPALAPARRPYPDGPAPAPAPERFYRRPPPPRPVQGPFSPTPPPPAPARAPPRAPPSTPSLSDEDLANIVKYMSREDLDRLVRMASANGRPPRSPDRYVRNDFNNDFDEVLKFAFPGPGRDYRDDGRPLSGPDGFASERVPYKRDVYESNDVSPRGVFVHAIGFAEDILNPSSGWRGLNDPGVYSPDQGQPETVLEYAMDSQNPNEVWREAGAASEPAAARAPAPRPSPSSYQVEDFGELPLMSYQSKLDSVSSYHVPHYTVVSNAPKASPSKPSKPSPSNPSPTTSIATSAEAAEAARAHSDAHLKAIKVWTHHSKGAAYTLHEDGTLSKELPLKPSKKLGG